MAIRRIPKEVTFILMALELAKQSTCSRRSVGAIFTNEKTHIISAGYNGVAYGLPHCIKTPCAGAGCRPGEGLELCEAIHAEQNALMWCSDVNKIHSAYITHSPCIHCVKMLMNTSCKNIYFAFEYAHNERSKKLWEQHGGSWNKVALCESLS